MTENEQPYTPSLDEARETYIVAKTRNHDSYLTGVSVAEALEVHGQDFDRMIEAVRAEAVRDFQIRAYGGVVDPWASRPASPATREAVADAISGIVVGSGYESVNIGITAALEAADALLAAFTITEKGAES